MKKSNVSDKTFDDRFSETKNSPDSFIKLERMTTEEYKNGGQNLSINYSFSESPFGQIIIATTPKGICYLAFAENETEALCSLKHKFPNARYSQIMDSLQKKAITIFNQGQNNIYEVKLHIKGTDFQMKVWNALLEIPMGRLCTYGEIASKVNNPKASRAVGTAVGNNPVSLLIPCHRVIRSSGELGEYHWGANRKEAILDWESEKIVNTL